MTTQTQKQMDVRFGQLVQWTLVAGLVAAVLNAIVYFVADIAGVWDGVVINMGTTTMAFTVVPVIASSIGFIVVGGFVLWLIAALSISEHPLRFWRNLALVVLVLSFGQPLLLLEAPLVTDLTLILMHIIAGVVTIYLLTTRLRSQA